MGRAGKAHRQAVTVDIVFFDAGETILHPHPSFPELFAETVARHRPGSRVSAARVAAVQAELAPHLVELAHESGVDRPSLSAEDSRLFWSHLYRSFLARLGIEDEELVAALYATFSDSSSYRLYDDALPALERLAGAGYRLGLISNFEAWLQEMLVELEVGHLFDVTVISGLAGVEKPDPAIYALALERAGVPAARAVHVGDSPALDVEPALAVGMRAVLLDRWARYPGFAPRIASLKELPDVVEGM